jgi:hypothetical protein
MRDPKPRTMVRIHLGMLALWTLLIPLSFVLMNSVAWVVFMSHYAIIASHWSGWDAARAEKAANDG